MMIKMTVEGIGIDPQSNPLVLLRDEEHKVFVPIWIGPAEAMSIQMELDQRQPPRPMTHDLIASAFRELGIQLIKVAVTDFEKQVYYATLHLRIGDEGQVREVDARPSDAIALALRAQCQIWVDDKVVDKTGIQVEEVAGESGEATAHKADEQPEAPARDASPEEINKFVKLLEGVDLSDKEGEAQSN